MRESYDMKFSMIEQQQMISTKDIKPHL